MEFPYDSVEKIVENGENAENQQFLFFLQCFQNPSFFGSLNHYQKTKF